MIVDLLKRRREQKPRATEERLPRLVWDAEAPATYEEIAQHEMACAEWTDPMNEPLEIIRDRLFKDDEEIASAIKACGDISKAADLIAERFGNLNAYGKADAPIMREGLLECLQQ